MSFPKVLATIAFASTVLFAANDLFLGSWAVKPNAEKSKASPGAQATMSIDATSDGYRIKLSNNSELTLHLDGHDYPREAFGVAKAVGADVVNARRLDTRTIETTFKRNGKPVATVRREVSVDGHVLTATTDEVLTTGEKRHSVVVFEKQ